MQDLRPLLSETFSQMSDEELMERWCEGYLTDVAIEVARTEFSIRGVKPPRYVAKDADSAPTIKEETPVSAPFESDKRSAEEVERGDLVEVARSSVTANLKPLCIRMTGERIPFFVVESDSVNARISDRSGRLLVPRQFAAEARKMASLVNEGAFSLRDDEDVHEWETESIERPLTQRKAEVGQPYVEVAAMDGGSNNPSQERDAPLLKELSLEFQGTAPEYFRIWIVNLCLTLLTLGVFSPWAKVRTKRYLYSRTLLDGTPFQYLGRPLPILKGRLIAVALFLIYFVSDRLVTSVLPVVLAAGLVLAPWAIARSAAFNARYSAYRNMTFSFDGDYVQAVMALYWTGVIPILALGSAFDWGGFPRLGDIGFAVFGLFFPPWLARLKTFLVDNTRFGGISGQLPILGGQLWGIYFRAGLIGVPFFVVLGMVLALSEDSHAPDMSIVATALALLVLLAGYASTHAYIQARSSNLVWNNTRLGPLRFESTLHADDLAWLYFSNTIAVIGSAALMTPWAVVRTIKYRASHLRVLLDADLAAFEGSKTGSVQAAGAEVGEIFGFDLSL
jgi:uncharacterized membrane protein YjgN (DUF898 family)